MSAINWPRAHLGVVSPGRAGFLVPGLGDNPGMGPSKTHRQLLERKESVRKTQKKGEPRGGRDAPVPLSSLRLSWGVGASSLDAPLDEFLA